MTDSTDISNGVAGSIVMTVLCIAVAVLLVSFYRRYKRANKNRTNQE
jgi:biopolymer transport protein ExbB/TolQ